MLYFAYSMSKTSFIEFSRLTIDISVVGGLLKSVVVERYSVELSIGAVQTHCVK